jgi:hypothetical protein
VSEIVRYRGWISDTRRWLEFPRRAGDIVICGPPKSGTTWMQTIVGLLVFDGLPDALISEVSPWLDMHLRSTEDMFALLAAQRHRRFIKTHAPLDGLPWDDDVTYIDVGRDPRDVFVSMRGHARNMSIETVERLRVETDDLVDLGVGWPDSDDPRLLVSAFLELEQHNDPGHVNLANLVHHHELAWRARHRPNVHLAHYADLTADLVGEMRRLRDVLDIGLSDARVEELSAHATLEAMRGRADRAAPEANTGIFKDPAAFFRSGRSGDGIDMMTDEELRRYDERCIEVTDDGDLLAWLHGGRTVADPTVAVSRAARHD